MCIRDRYRSAWTDGFQFALGYSFNADATDGNQSGFRTVSYTHLDVYKRQMTL